VRGDVGGYHGMGELSIVALCARARCVIAAIRARTAPVPWQGVSHSIADHTNTINPVSTESGAVQDCPASTGGISRRGLPLVS
jgi:hypothetical protein